jgi:hypothetical protein
METNVFDIARKEIEKEFNEAIAIADRERLKKLEALNILRPTLQKSILSEISQSENNTQSEQADNSTIFQLVGTTNSPLRPRIISEIRSFAVGERITQPIIFENLSLKYEDVRTSATPGNIRSNISQLLNMMTRRGELRLLERGRASEPHTYTRIAQEERN